MVAITVRKIRRRLTSHHRAFLYIVGCSLVIVLIIFHQVPESVDSHQFPLRKELTANNNKTKKKKEKVMSEKKLAIATRIHLGKASEPPLDEELERIVKQYATFSQNAFKSYIAVDASKTESGYSLMETLQKLIVPRTTLIPVSPWGNFVPALNTIVAQASKDGADYCLMASAETNTTQTSIDTLLSYMVDDGDGDGGDTLVVGAVLPGHDYRPSNKRVELTGRTTPWNTLAVWNLHKLALTGFPLVAEGVHRNPDGTLVAAGVEEVSCIALLQRALGQGKAQAKLVALPDVKWEQDFGGDEERRKWHESKMKSKVIRPARHLELLNLQGVVQHV